MVQAGRLKRNTIIKYFVDLFGNFFVFSTIQARYVDEIIYLLIHQMINVCKKKYIILWCKQCEYRNSESHDIV